MLQKGAGLIARTQERLATGRKINNALDNPTGYFASQAHLYRAAALMERKDSVKEGIQSIAAAINGVTAITGLLATAKGVANAARITGNQTEVKSYASTFNTIIAQIDTLAADSGYRGTTLLTNQPLTMSFSESSAQSTLDIGATDATSAGLGITATNSDYSATADSGGPFVTGNFLFSAETFTLDEASNIISNNDKYRFVSGAAIATVNPSMAQTNTLWSLNGNVVSGTFSSGAPMTLEFYADGVDQVTGLPLSNRVWDIETTLNQLESATESLRTYTRVLSSNSSVMTTRLDFIADLSGVLQTGADNLTLADMNEEGANMLMLQTRNNLGLASLGISAQTDQSVMRLFR